MHAIVRVAGVQARVEPGDRIRLPKLNVEAGMNTTFEDVLLLSDGDTVTVGTPTVEGASVAAEVLQHARGEKVIVFKKKRRKRYTKTRGHRQDYTEVRITDILTGGSAPAAEPVAQADTSEEE